MAKVSEVKVPRGFKINWMGMRKHLLRNELILRGVYQQGDEGEQMLTMAGKLSVWEAGLWKNFRESDDLFVFAAEQWRLLAPEVRRNATEMGVKVVAQEKSHWIHGMLLKKNEEAIEIQKAKEKEAAPRLLAKPVPRSSTRSRISKEKQNIVVAHADIGLGELLELILGSFTKRILTPTFENPHPVVYTPADSTIHHTYTGLPSPATTATLDHEEEPPTVFLNHRNKFTNEEDTSSSSSRASSRSSSTRFRASETRSSYHNIKPVTPPRASHEIKIDRLLREQATMEQARIQVLRDYLSPEAFKFVMEKEAEQRRVGAEIAFYS